MLEHADHAERGRILKEAKAPGDGFRHPTLSRRPDQRDPAARRHDAVELSDKNLIVVNDRLLRAPAPGRSAQEIKREIAQERKRISGVPPAQQDALLRANADLADARAAHADARAKHAYMAGTHKDLKKALANAELVEPAKGAQLYDSKAEATRVANLQEFDATTFKAGEQWGVVPKVAKDGSAATARSGPPRRSVRASCRAEPVVPQVGAAALGPLAVRAGVRSDVPDRARTRLQSARGRQSLARERAVYASWRRWNPASARRCARVPCAAGSSASTSIAREFMGPAA